MNGETDHDHDDLSLENALGGDAGENAHDKRLEALEAEIAKLRAEIAGSKKKPKDRWDIFQIVASLLIPASIAFVGVIISYTMNRAEVEVAAINAEVAQAALVSTFIDPLTDKDDSNRRKIALAALAIALPDLVPHIAVLLEDDSDPGVSEGAGIILLRNRVGEWTKKHPRNAEALEKWLKENDHQSNIRQWLRSTEATRSVLERIVRDLSIPPR